MIEPGKVECPKCEQTIDRVDGEYGLHYVVMNVICTMSKREIKEDEIEEGEKSNGQQA